MLITSKIPGTKRVDHKRAVKIYERAAGDKVIPSDLRPPEVLKVASSWRSHGYISSHHSSDSEPWTTCFTTSSAAKGSPRRTTSFATVHAPCAMTSPFSTIPDRSQSNVMTDARVSTCLQCILNERTRDSHWPWRSSSSCTVSCDQLVKLNWSLNLPTSAAEPQGVLHRSAWHIFRPHRARNARIPSPDTYPGSTRTA